MWWEEAKGTNENSRTVDDDRGREKGERQTNCYGIDLGHDISSCSSYTSRYVTILITDIDYSAPLGGKNHLERQFSYYAVVVFRGSRKGHPQAKCRGKIWGITTISF